MPLPSITEAYKKAWTAIVKPLRIEYSIDDLGPTQFNVNQSLIKRTDFTLTNKHGTSLACSFYENTSSTSPLPCVVYLHANGSCRLEAIQYKQIVLAANVHFFCFDFSACGLSGGDYGSVGHFEQDDIEQVIQHLNESGKVTKIALWGRSMGAVTAIMYASKNPSISCIVLDSPFAEFKRLVQELVKNRANIPPFLTSVALSMIRRTVKKKAKFDIYELKPIEYSKMLKIPALFGAPKDDTFVSPQHTKDLYMAHSGEKRLLSFEGDHNSQRPLEWIVLVMDFIKAQLFEGADQSTVLNKPDAPGKLFGNVEMIKNPQLEMPSNIKDMAEKMPGKET
jgi:pimeloyl-ACP methyl ester carboxylesterase